MYCVGSGLAGALGDSSTADSSAWVRAGALSLVGGLDGSLRTYCAVSSAGRVDCWGRGFDGASDVLSPVEIRGTGTAVSVAVGYTTAAEPYACVRRDDGTVA